MHGIIYMWNQKTLKKIKLTETESEKGWSLRKKGEVGKWVQILSYERNKI